MESEFQHSITSAQLPRYRLDRHERYEDATAPASAAARVSLQRPLLEDVLLDVAAPAPLSAAAATKGASTAAAAAAGATAAGGGGGAGADATANSQNRLAAWRLQIRAIFFPRAHIIAQQQLRRGEALAVLDQSTEWFETLSLLLTVANIVAVAADDPTTPDSDPRKLALDKFDTFFSLFYLFEMVIRITSFGIGQFWADQFNRLDAIVVVFGILSLALKLTSSSLANITFVRALRVLRPLRTMTQFRQTRLTVASVIGSFRELLDVWMLFMVFFGVLCVLAIDPFRGNLRNNCVTTLYQTSFADLPPLTVNTSANDTAFTRAVAGLKAALREARDPLRYFSRLTTESRWREFVYNTSTRFAAVADYECAGPVDAMLGLTATHTAECANRRCSPILDNDGRYCPYGYVCLKGENQHFGYLGFDNIFMSGLTTFVLLTTSYWVDIYTQMIDASTGLAGFYCIVTVVVGRYFVVSVIIAIVTDRFREKHRQQQLVLQQQEDAAARASRRIRVKSLIETSLEAVERYFEHLRRLEEIEIHHDFASALEEDVLVRRTKRDWDSFRFLDEDYYDAQATMMRRSASVMVAASPASGSSAAAPAQSQQQQQQMRRRKSHRGGTGVSASSGGGSSGGAATATAADDDDGHTHFALDRDARRRRYFAREVVLRKWFLWARVGVSAVTLAYLASEFEGVDDLAGFSRARLYTAMSVLACWFIELTLRVLSRRWLLLITDMYFMTEVVCVLALGLSLLGNLGARFGSLSEAFFLGRFSVFLSESHRITALYRWIRIIVAAFRSSIVLILIILLALFLLACSGMQVFGAQMCNLASGPMSVDENIRAIADGTCVRPRSNFDSFSGAMASAFQILTGDQWELIMFAGMQSVWNRNENAGGAVLVGAIAVSFVAAFVILNYLFANLFISILLNSRAVNEAELRRDAVRIQREIHYSRLLAQRQLQLEAGMFDVAAVASALFKFNQFYRDATKRSRRVFQVLFSDKVAGRLAAMRRNHVFSTLHVLCIMCCTLGLIFAVPILPPDTLRHWTGLLLVHVSTVGCVVRLVCEVLVESFKMRVRTLRKRQRKANDLFDFSSRHDGDDDDVDDDAIVAAAGSVIRAKSSADGAAKKEADLTWAERYSTVAYFSRSRWHLFELLLVIAGCTFGVLRIFFSTFNVFVWLASCVLCFRPLGLLERAVGLQPVLRDIAHMLRNLVCILSLIAVFYVFYSLLGVQLLRGRMSACSNATIVDVANCTRGGHLWAPVALNFDDLASASYTLYAIATFSDWTDVYYNASAAGHSTVVAFLISIYFFVFIIAGGLFAQALITMMLIDTFEVRRLVGTERASRQDQARTLTDERFRVQQKLIARVVPREVAEKRRAALLERLGGAGAAAARQELEREQQLESQQTDDAQGLGQRGLRMTQSTWFRNIVGVVIFLSFCVSASYRYPMSDFWLNVNYWADVIFTALFTVELLLHLLFQTLCVDLPKGTKWYKRVPLRIFNAWRVHFSSKWNWFDAIIVVLSISGVALERYADKWAWTKNFRALRALRLLRLVKNNPRIAGMMSRLGGAIRQLLYVSIIFGICFASFGLLGLRLFGHVKHDTTLLSDRVGFSTLIGSMLMMMRVATLNRWPATMVAMSVQPPRCDPNIGECGTGIVARGFMVSTTIVFGFVLSNMFVAVLVDAYMSRRQSEGDLTSQCALTQEEVNEFAENFVTWPSMDPVFFTIPTEHVVPFLRYLRRPALLRQQQAALAGGAGAGGAPTARMHPFALPQAEVRWRQPQWDLVAAQQLNFKEYAPGLVDYWSLVHALCDLRFVRELPTTAGSSGSTVGANGKSTVRAGVLGKSDEKSLKRKFLLKVPARQQQLQNRRSKRAKQKKTVVDDDMEDAFDEEDEEMNPVVDDNNDNPFNGQPRFLLEVYAVSRLREIMVSMPAWRGFMLEAVAEQGGAPRQVGGDGGADAAAAATEESGLFTDPSIAVGFRDEESPLRQAS